MPLVTRNRKTGQTPILERTQAEDYASRCCRAVGPVFWELIHNHDRIRDADWMYDRISEPDLQGHPAYAKAAFRSLDYDAALIPMYWLMAEQEIIGNRYWKLLSVQQREELGCAMNWCADPDQEDLFGQALSLAEYAGMDVMMFQRTTRRVVRSVATFDCYDGWIRKGLLRKRNPWWPTMHTNGIRTDLLGPMVKTSGTDESGARPAARSRTRHGGTPRQMPEPCSGKDGD